MAIDDKIIKIFTLIFDLHPDQIHIDLTQNNVVKWDSHCSNAISSSIREQI